MRRHAVHYLILPGWQGSPTEHWQSHWQRSLPDASRVAGVREARAVDVRLVPPPAST